MEWSSILSISLGFIFILYYYLKKSANAPVGNIAIYGPKGALAAGGEFNQMPLETLRDAKKRHGNIFAINLFFFKAVFLLGGENYKRLVASPSNELSLAAGVKTYLYGMFGVDVTEPVENTTLGYEDFHKSIGIAFNNKSFMDNFLDAISDEIEDFWASVANKGPIDVLQSAIDLVALINLRCFMGKETRDRIGDQFKKDWPQFEINGMNPATIFLHKYLPFLPSVRRTKELRARISGWILSAIKQRREELEKNPDATHFDYLQGVMKNLADASDLDKCYHIMAILFAAEVNTAGSTGWGIAFFLSHPEEFAKLNDEIQNTLGDATGRIAFNDLKKMEYSSRAIREIVRLRQATLTMRKSVKDVTIDGKTIPKDTMVFGYPRFQNMDPETFQEPEKFNPDRLLTEEKAKLSAFMPFGAGRHPCLGEQYAIVIVKLAWAKLFTKYNVELLNKELPEPMWDNTLGVSVTAHQPIRVNITSKK